MSQYAKLIAASVGLLAMLLKQTMGLDLGDETVSKIVDAILAIGTAVSVYMVPNQPKQ